MRSRYIVTELEGYGSIRNKSGQARTGLSCHVIDTAWNYRLVATYRTEDEGSRLGDRRFARVREKARDHAERLNATLPVGRITFAPPRGFRPTCPRCSFVCDPGARYCVECGCRLYPASFYPERKR